MAGPQLSVSNPALSGLSSAPMSSTVVVSATASTTASSTPQSPTFSIKIVSAKKKASMLYDFWWLILSGVGLDGTDKTLDGIFG